MKKTLLLLIGLLAIAAGSRFTAADEKSAVDGLVDSEKAFAAASVAKGTREAFLSYLADDSVLFRPRPVPGKKWVQDSDPSADLLTWQPSFADVSSSGDMGYTTGPWEYKAKRDDEKPIRFGHFVSVWKKQNDGNWKVVVDTGIVHQEHIDKSPKLSTAHNSDKRSEAKIDSAAEKRTLLERDRVFAKAVSSEGAEKAFIEFSAEEIRFYRSSSFPMLGKDAMRKSLSLKPGSFNLDPAFADVSNAGDLGYTYGSFEYNEANKPAEFGCYLRIWKKIDGAWKIVFDVSSPAPPK